MNFKYNTKSEDERFHAIENKDLNSITVEPLNTKALYFP